MKGFIVLITLIMLPTLILSQSCIGKWITYDDHSGKQKSVVELYKQKDRLYGKITYVFPAEGISQNTTCTACKDDRKGKSIVGLEIIRDLKWDGTSWYNGSIMDPEIGKIYDVKIWLDDKNHDRLIVRGYVGLLFRTQYWKRLYIQK
jgi:uncharacterized protein (DUF2147 family)